MKIIELTKEYIPRAEKLMMENYFEERSKVPALPESPDFPKLDGLISKGIAVAAVEGDKLLGYLGAFGPHAPVFCTKDTAGFFSPIHAHAAQKENRARIYQRMYEAASEKWVRSGALSHTISLYTHDSVAKEAFFTYGFGMRCMDLIRENEKIEGDIPQGINVFELDRNRQSDIRCLREALAHHLGKSPCFMVHTKAMNENWISKREADKPRIFAAADGTKIIAYIELSKDGENFSTEGDDMLNISGAFCLEEYRGQNIAKGILSFMSDSVREEGITKLGVDCESFNPTALHFWQKYFTPYTLSLVRRIDELALI
ncbi:MAG: GNAT family N-acetyltransferase [Clostridiales bacterium]|nr:GNAT family N-acetyltransferase [Clostridiales bacterium]